MNIKKMIKKDIADVSILASLLYHSSIEEIIEDFNKLINKDNIVLYLEIDNRKIGFAHFSIRKDYVEGTKSNPVLYLEGIYIKEEYRNNGYSKLLINEGIKWGKENDCKEFASDCEETNVNSINFHKKIGFNEVNRIVCFTKEI